MIKVEIKITGDLASILEQTKAESLSLLVENGIEILGQKLSLNNFELKYNSCSRSKYYYLTFS